MPENYTPERIERAVISSIAKIQCRPTDHYQDIFEIVVSSCDIAAMLPTLEQDLGCAPFQPSDFAPVTSGGEGGVCYDPLEDMPINDICKRVAARVTGSAGEVR